MMTCDDTPHAMLHAMSKDGKGLPNVSEGNTVGLQVVTRRLNGVIRGV